ncbi:MAG TPA: HAMP domain-containing sensor histidine kinase [Gaiellaceae bacterium]|nr:HAMP domain-containing sensor histidine kinase [Gaiellaceae bacterium]
MTTTETTTAATEPETTTAELRPEEGAGGGVSRFRPRRSLLRLNESFRVRVVGGYIALLLVATAISVVVAREALHGGLDRRIHAELVQESRELRQLAGGRDPATGEPFRNRVERIFEVYLSRNVASRNEVLLTFVDGRPFLRSRGEVPYRLDQDPELVARWATLRESDRGSVDTPAGHVEYLAVPLVSGDSAPGVFVAAIFRDRETGEVNDALRVAVGVGLAMLLVGSVLAWLLADRVLKPVTTVTEAARSISSGDLSRRIPVSGHDEIAVLAGTFNDMLARLETAFEAQRRFVDDAGHELRTPITIVRGHLELLEDDPDERRETLALVLDELDRMARMVNDMLTLAKWERPDFLKPEPVDVGLLTDDVLAKAGALGDRRWELDARAEGTLVADRQRVTQALMQLAENAVRHTADGDRIGLGSFVGDGEVRLWVRDTGPGIPFEEQEQVFSRFYRPAESRGSEGAGLGLSIVQAIALAHGGRVDLSSVPGLGATFTVVLPRQRPGDRDPLGEEA